MHIHTSYSHIDISQDKQKLRVKYVMIFLPINLKNVCFGYSKEPSHVDLALLSTYSISFAQEI